MTIRPFRASDKSAIVELLTLSFPVWRERSRISEYWNWKYQRNPLGFFPSTIGLAQYDGKLVGHFSLIPRKVKIGNSIILAGLMADAVIHPDYRSQGIFIRLARKVLTDIRRDEFKMAYSFGLGSRILTMKIPWASHEEGAVSELRARSFEVPMRLVKILNVERMVKISFGSDFLPRITELGSRWLMRGFGTYTSFASTANYAKLRRVQRFDGRFDRLWMGFMEKCDVVTERSSSYLNWRYIDVPSDIDYVVFSAEENGEIEGYIVLRSLHQRGLKIGYIVDMLALPNRGDVVALLISKSLGFFKARSVDLVQCLMLSTHPYYRILQDHGFLAPPNWLVKMLEEVRALLPSASGGKLFSSERPYFNICINSSDSEIVKTFSSKPSDRWFLTSGDWDTV